MLEPNVSYLRGTPQSASRTAESHFRHAALVAVLLVVGLPGVSFSLDSLEGPGAAEWHAPSSVEAPIVVAQADGSGNEKGSRPLEPRYYPIEPEEKSWYNGSYIFGMTRGLADSTIHPAAKGPLFLFTVPLDFAFLPFAVIGGMFG